MTEELENEKRFDFLEERFREVAAGKKPDVSYFSVAGLRMRVECYAPEFAPTMSTQLACCRADTMEKWDITVRVWKSDVSSYRPTFGGVEFFQGFRGNMPIIEYDWNNGWLCARDCQKNVAYLVARSFDQRTIAKNGHIFVRLLHTMIRNQRRALIHSAAVGLDDYGALICGRGGRGKSTLAVSCLLEDFQYVSDDYLILEKTDTLRAYPIYSVITLTKEMQSQLPALRSRYLYPNWNGSKDVLDITAHHKSFVDRLPIRVAVFPEFSNGDVPSIEPMPNGQPVVQIVHSTITQMSELNNSSYVKRLISLVDRIPFYKIRIGRNLTANARELKNFLKKKACKCTD